MKKRKAKRTFSPTSYSEERSLKTVCPFPVLVSQAYRDSNYENSFSLKVKFVGFLDKLGQINIFLKSSNT